MAAYELKKYEKAETILKQCPKSFNVKLCQIKVWFQLKQYRKALQLCGEITQVTYPRDRSNLKKQANLVQGMFWLGKLRFEMKQYIDAYPTFSNMTWEMLHLVDEDKPYKYQKIVLKLVPQIMEMAVECFNQAYKAIRAKHVIEQAQ